MIKEQKKRELHSSKHVVLSAFNESIRLGEFG